MSVDLTAGGGASPPPVQDETREAEPDGRVAAQDAQVPQRATGVQLIGLMKGSGYRNPPSLVRRADGQVIQLTPLLFSVLEAVDGHRDVGAVAAEASRLSGRNISADNVIELIDNKLRPLGLIRLPDGTDPAVRKANPLLALRFRLVLSNPKLTRRITAPFAFLFHPLIVAAGVAGFAAAAWWVLAQRGLGFAASQAFSNPALLLTVFLVSLISAGFHEFGHAAGARYGGATPGAIGAGLYLLWPAFYTDVTDSYRLGRAGRLRTDLGGVYFNAVLALAVFGLWWVTGWEALLLLIPVQILQMIKQLPPLLRFDGYHLLADITGIPDLYYRIKPTLLGFLPKYWKRPESKALKPWAKAVVTLWVVLVVPFMALSLFITVVTMPRIVASAAASLHHQWQLMTFYFGHSDTGAGLVKMLGVVAVGLPVAGITYLLARLLRGLVLKTITSTANQPGKRAGAAAVGALAIGALAFAWWPHGNYRPIQPYERGTIQDAVPALFQSPGLHRGEVRSARVIWPQNAGRLPTSSHPVLALVLVPKAEQTAGQKGSQSLPTWVFPFNRPGPPGPGDNQALAVNTTDGSSVYQVAFALVWANSSQPVLNSNQAYAFADCQNCSTTAVAFQVVLVVGDANVVAPQNLAGVLNYDCVSCVSQALADQLILTLPPDPSPQEVAAIDAVWSQIEAFGQNLRGLSFSQIESQLAGYEAQLTSIVNQYSPQQAAGAAGSSTTPTTLSSSSSTVVNGSTPATTAAGTSPTTGAGSDTSTTIASASSGSSASTTTAPTTTATTSPTTAPPTTSPPTTSASTP